MNALHDEWPVGPGAFDSQDPLQPSRIIRVSHRAAHKLVVRSQKEHVIEQYWCILREPVVRQDELVVRDV
jgi:hypothetical protein